NLNKQQIVARQDLLRWHHPRLLRTRPHKNSDI
ncbi:MAG: hypothetical protein ACI892_001718, partial [Marinobacter maritimus]